MLRTFFIISALRLFHLTFINREQIAWLSIGLASMRFRQAWIAQGRPLSELKFRARWTWPWGPLFVVRETLFSVL